MSSDVYSTKRQRSRSSHSHGHSSNNNHRHRYRRRRLNADLFDDDNYDRRDDWAKRPLSPDSLWKELQFQRYLRNRMRRSMQAKSRVVDSKGREVTLAERIIRQKLLQSKNEENGATELEDRPSTSHSEGQPPQKEKKETFINLLHQYIHQREAETACSSKLLEEISEAKQSLNDNVFKRRVSSSRDVCSSANISLGDSATHYNAKFRALQKGVTVDNDAHSIKDDRKSQHEDSVDDLGVKPIEPYDSTEQNEDIKRSSVVVLNDSDLLNYINQPTKDENTVEVNDQETGSASATKSLENVGSKHEHCIETGEQSTEQSESENKNNDDSVIQQDKLNSDYTDGVCSNAEIVILTKTTDGISQETNSETCDNQTTKVIKNESDIIDECELKKDDICEADVIKNESDAINKCESKKNDNCEADVIKNESDTIDECESKKDDICEADVRSEQNEHLALCTHGANSSDGKLDGSMKTFATPGDENINEDNSDCSGLVEDNVHDSKDMESSVRVESNVNTNLIDPENNDLASEKNGDTSNSILEPHSDTKKAGDENKLVSTERMSRASIKSDQHEVKGDTKSLTSSGEGKAVNKYSKSNSSRSDRREENTYHSKVHASYNDDKKSEKDSAIENSDDETNNRNINKSRASDTSSNRAYQFTGFCLERAYTLPELVPTDLKEIFTGHRDLSNRERGQKLTLFSSPEGSNTTITSHILPSSTYKSCLPLPPVKSVTGEDIEPKRRLKPPTMKEATVSCPNMSAYRDNNSQISSDSEGYTTDDEIEDSGFLDHKDNNSSHNSTDRNRDKHIHEAISCMFKADCKRQNAHLSYQDMPDREKRVIGLYNELKCFSLLQRSKENITIAMASRPNGLNDIHIEWGSKDGVSNKNRLRKRAKYRKPKISRYSTKIYDPSKLAPKHHSIIAAASHTPTTAKPPWEIQSKPHEFIYLRDLSFSHYVAKAVYENRLQKYTEHGRDRDSHALKKRPRPRIRPANNPVHDRPTDISVTPNKDRETQTLLPLINRNRHVSLISSTVNSMDDSYATQVENTSQTERGKKAYNKLKKRLRLPSIHK